MDEINLNKEEVKALLSDIRMELLNSLKERRKTLTELSREFDLSKSTLFEHLGVLTKSGLIEKNTEYTNKWVYYELTKKGARIVGSENRKIVLMLAFTLIIGAGIFMFLLPMISLTPSMGQATDYYSLKDSIIKEQDSTLKEQSMIVSDESQTPIPEYDAVPAPENPNNSFENETSRSIVEEKTSSERDFSEPKIYYVNDRIYGVKGINNFNEQELSIVVQAIFETSTGSEKQTTLLILDENSEIIDSQTVSAKTIVNELFVDEENQQVTSTFIYVEEIGTELETEKAFIELK